MQKSKKIKRILRVGLAEDSGLASFVERPVPSDQELASFERAVRREANEQEIDQRLSEIYLDKRGRRVDLGRMNVRKKANWFWRLAKKIFWLAVAASLAYYAYFYWSGGSPDVGAAEFKIEAPETVVAGQELVYLVKYRNPTKYPLKEIRLELQYPINFIFASSSLTPASGDYGWDLEGLEPGAAGTLEIKGQMIGVPESVNVVFGNFSYLSGALTSRFKKEASASTVISGAGFRADLVYSQTAFFGQENEISLVLSDIQNNYLGDFDLSFSLPAEANAFAVISTTTPAASSSGLLIAKNGGNSWRLSQLSAASGRQEVPLVYIMKNKAEGQAVSVRLEKRLDNGESYIFWEKVFVPQLVSSDLNLTMMLGGSKEDGAFNFGDDLLYTLTYANRGPNAYRDVVIMAVIDSDLVDWNSLVDQQHGKLVGRSLVWTKNELPALAEIKPGAEGEISFRLKLRGFQEDDFGRDLKFTAYSQYGIDNNVRGPANRSNTLIGRLNSNLALRENIRYFNDDNVPVGSGPLPPQSGAKTSLKVYWSVTNSLHELTDVRVVLPLPDKIKFEMGATAEVGSIAYDQDQNQVVWEIGRLPISVPRASAEFALSLTPEAGDRGKILVVSSGATVSATDAETKQILRRRSPGKTTKLEDDDIAGLNNSGIIQ